ADADGRYELAGIPREGFRVRVLAAGHGRFDFAVVEATDATASLDREQDFFLLPGLSASGRVLDHDGAPVSGATLWCSASRLDRVATQQDDIWSTSDDAGRFELEPLRFDVHHTLLVQAPGHALAVFDFPADAPRRPHTELGDLRLEAPGAIAGT